VPGGIGVFVDNNGRLGTFNSSERFKEAIKPMDQASEAILALKPVTFRYKRELDPEGIPQFGLVAEQVEKVNTDLVARDDQGKVSTVRYEAVNAMLLNEFLKEHRKVQELEAAIVRQQNDFAQQQKEIRVLTASLKQQAMQVRNLLLPAPNEADSTSGATIALLQPNEAADFSEDEFDAWTPGRRDGVAKAFDTVLNETLRCR
jgi:endosialidase-like protein